MSTAFCALVAERNYLKALTSAFLPHQNISPMKVMTPPLRTCQGLGTFE